MVVVVDVVVVSANLEKGDLRAVCDCCKCSSSLPEADRSRRNL